MHKLPNMHIYSQVYSYMQQVYHYIQSTGVFILLHIIIVSAYTRQGM